MLFKKNKGKSILGVDISREKIKIVELERIDSDPEYDYKILNYIVKEAPKGVFYKEDQLDSQVVGEFLKEIVAEEKLAKTRAVCAVPAERSVEKTFKVPLDSTDDEVENVILNSSKTYTTNGIETMAFDFYEKIEERTEENKTIVLKMCNLEAMTSREDSLLIGDLTPLVIETDDAPLSRLSKTLRRQYNLEIGDEIKKEDTYMFVEITNSTVTINTLTNDKVSSTNEELLKKEVVNIEAVYAQVIDIIRKNIFIVESNTENFKALFLSGENDVLFKLRSMMERLEDEAGVEEFKDIEILVANPLLDIKYGGVNLETITIAAPSLVIPCGLAMAEIDKYE